MQLKLRGPFSLLLSITSARSRNPHLRLNEMTSRFVQCGSFLVEKRFRSDKVKYENTAFI